MLFVKHPGTPVGDDCGSSDHDVDAGTTPDAGVDVDVPEDAGFAADAGSGCDSEPGEAITMIVQPRFFAGEDGARFAFLMVTPGFPEVIPARASVFRDLALETAPALQIRERLVQDEALGYQCRERAGGCAPSGSYHDPVGQGDGVRVPDPPPVLPEPDDAARIDTVGAYEVARLTIATVTELAAWLDDAGYVYTVDDLAALEPYVSDGWTVIAVRVAAEPGYRGGLEPLAFTYPGTEIRVPVGVSRVVGAPGEMQLTVYVAAEGRYDVPGGTVRYAEDTPVGRAQFLTRTDLWIDLTLGADADPVAERHPSDAGVREVEILEQIVRIPVNRCPDEDIGPCSDCAAHGGPGGGGLALFGLCALALLRRRR